MGDVRSRKGGKRRGRQWRRRAGDGTGTAEPPVDASLAEAAARLQADGMPALRAALKAMGLRPGGRTKGAMALRLARARRAEGFAAQLAASRSRFDGDRAGRQTAAAEMCRLCTGPVAPPRRTFCCDECVHFHLVRTSGSHVRKALAIRDDGVRPDLNRLQTASGASAQPSISEPLDPRPPAARPALRCARRCALAAPSTQQQLTKRRRAP